MRPNRYTQYHGNLGCADTNFEAFSMRRLTYPRLRSSRSYPWLAAEEKVKDPAIVYAVLILRIALVLGRMYASCMIIFDPTVSCPLSCKNYFRSFREGQYCVSFVVFCGLSSNKRLIL